MNPDFPYWTDQGHVYQENEMVVCAMQHTSPEKRQTAVEQPLELKQREYTSS